MLNEKIYVVSAFQILSQSIELNHPKLVSTSRGDQKCFCHVVQETLVVVDPSSRQKFQAPARSSQRSLGMDWMCIQAMELQGIAAVHICSYLFIQKNRSLAVGEKW